MTLRTRCLIMLACLLSTAAASAKDATWLHYRVAADDASGRVTLSCGEGTSGACTFAVGGIDAVKPRTLTIAPGSSSELGPDEADGRYCAGGGETQPEWPACLNGPTSGVLRKSRSVDFRFW